MPKESDSLNKVKHGKIENVAGLDHLSCFGEVRACISPNKPAYQGRNKHLAVFLNVS
jgi:hypothetical protein